MDAARQICIIRHNKQRYCAPEWNGGRISVAGVLLIAAGDLLAQGEHQAARLGRAAVGRLGDSLTEVTRIAADGKAEVFAHDAAGEQACSRHVEHLSNLRQLLKRRRALATLKTAKVQLGNFQALRSLFLREAGLRARGADVAPDGLIVKI